jgi:lincosamide nucleotidyltransferase
MMMFKERLLRRLDGIGYSLQQCEGALALLGLGSVGTERDRIDEFSDLDFFVIVAQGYKQRFIDRLDWLEKVHPLGFSFKNSAMGYKILFDDGIYGEYAVFELDELNDARYTGGEIVWRHPSFTTDDIVAGKATIPSVRSHSTDHVLGEAITNLYVGLGRYLRGEKLSAYRFVQCYPIDGLLSIMHLLEQEVNYFPDPFGNERRIERRFPSFANRLGDLVQGYHRTPQSALSLLAYIESIIPVSPRMSKEIKMLAQRCIEQDNR